MLTDLALEIIKLQEELEYWINSDEHIDKKLKKIKKLLSKIVNNELVINKFKTYINTDENNN